MTPLPKVPRPNPMPAEVDVDRVSTPDEFMPGIFPSVSKPSSTRLYTADMSVAAPRAKSVVVAP